MKCKTFLFFFFPGALHHFHIYIFHYYTHIGILGRLYALTLSRNWLHAVTSIQKKKSGFCVWEASERNAPTTPSCYQREWLIRTLSIVPVFDNLSGLIWFRFSPLSSTWRNKRERDKINDVEMQTSLNSGCINVDNRDRQKGILCKCFLSLFGCDFIFNEVLEEEDGEAGNPVLSLSLN